MSGRIRRDIPVLPEIMWASRIDTAASSFRHWEALPLEARLDRVFKEAGVRDLIVENQRLRDDLNRSRAYRESIEGLPEGTLPRV